MYQAVKIETGCCAFVYVGVMPVVRNAEIECPKCGKMNNPKIIEDDVGVS